MTGPLSRYLDVLTGRGHGRGWIEVRYRHEGGMRSRFYPAGSRRGLLERLVLRTALRTDVYVGCALRNRQRGVRQAVGEAWVLWAECDSADAADALASFAVPPTLCVASGTAGHIHAYWALTVPTEVDTLETANRGLAQTLGADPVCYDAGRILRPPETFNHKHSPATAVHAIELGNPEAVYELSDIVRYLPPLEQASADRSPRQDDATDRLLAIAPTEYVSRLLGRAVGRDGKTRCPFHDDRTPSLHVYATPERGWYCFGCGRGGSIYDLASQLWLLETRGAEFLELRTRLLAELE